MSFITWERENNPALYEKPWGHEYYDREMLNHVISNVDRPEGMSEHDFTRVMDNVAHALGYVPVFSTAPRVYSIDEISGADNMPAWLEVGRRLFPVIVLANGQIYSPDIVDFKNSMPEELDEDEYDLQWRVWDKKPSNGWQLEMPWGVTLND